MRVSNIDHYFVLRESANGNHYSELYDTYEEAYIKYTQIADDDYFKYYDQICEVNVKPLEIKCPFEEELNEILNTSVNDMKLSNRLSKCLINNGIQTIKDICNCTYGDITKIKGLGKKAIIEFEKVLIRDYNMVYKYYYREKEENAKLYYDPKEAKCRSTWYRYRDDKEINNIIKIIKKKVLSSKDLNPTRSDRIEMYSIMSQHNPNKKSAKNIYTNASMGIYVDYIENGILSFVEIYGLSKEDYTKVYRAVGK